MKLNIAEFVLLTSLLYDLAASTLELSHESAAKQETEQLSVLCKETDNGDGTSWWGPKHKKLGEKTNPMARTKTFGLQLLFHKIKKEDAGTYTCKTKFESANFTLFVGQPFMFVNTPLEQEGQEGTNVLVKCESTGTYVNWLIDNQAPQEPKYKVMGDGLLVVNATKEDARHYTCKAVSEKLGEMDDITIYLKITPNTYSLTQLEHTTLYEVRAATENPADLSDFTDTSLFETEPNAASTFKNNSHTTFVASFAFSILIIFLNGLFESK